MKHAKEKTYRRGSLGAVSVLVFLCTAGALFLTGWMTGMSAEELTRGLVLCCIGAGCLVFALVRAALEDSLLYDNRMHPWRFLCIYLFCLLLALLYILLPVSGWPFLVLAVALTLFSNETAGIISTAVLLYITVSFSGAADSIFLLYFLTSMTGAILFARLDENFHAFYPTLISFLVLFTAQMAVIVLFTNERLNVEMLIIPVMNLFMNGILLMIVLKFFSSAVIHKYREVYLEINDPECPLLVELKKKSIASYYRSVHTAYLCERTAARLGLDTTLCKLGGYYFRLEEFSEDEGIPALQLFEEKYRFPPRVLALLQECNGDMAKIQSREAVIVLLADEMIKSLTYLFEKDKKAQIDYRQLVDKIMDKKVRGGMFRHCNLSFAEYDEVRSILIGEKLYYDFLR